MISTLEPTGKWGTVCTFNDTHHYTVLVHDRECKNSTRGSTLDLFKNEYCILLKNSKDCMFPKIDQQPVHTK